MKKYFLFTFASIFICNGNVMAISDYAIYYTKIDAIYSVNNTGSNQNLIIQKPFNQISYQNIELDRNNQNLYWTEIYQGMIQTSNIYGNNVKTIVADSKDTYGIRDVAIDNNTDKLYWSNSIGGTTVYNTIHPLIYTTDLTNNNSTPLISGTGRAWNIDVVDDYIYWNETSREDYSSLRFSYIKRAKIDGTQIETLYKMTTDSSIFGNSYILGGIDVDSSSEYIYWSENYNDKSVIYKMNLKNNSVSEVLSEDSPENGFEYIYDVVVDNINDELYWLKEGLFKSDLDGNNISLIFDTGIAYSLALDPVPTTFEVLLNSNQTFTTDYITLGDTFTFDYFWDMGTEPTSGNFDVLFFNGTEWETLGWQLNSGGTSTDWASASFYVPTWARGENVQIKFSLLDFGQQTNPTVYLRNISSNSAPVPEPSTLILFGCGLAGLAAVGRRKQK